MAPTRSVHGTDHLKAIVWFLARAPEPMTLYRLAKMTGLPVATVRYIVQNLVEKGDVLQTEDGRYVMNPSVVQIYEDVVIYRLDENAVMFITPTIETVEQLQDYIRRLPATIKLWVMVDESLGCFAEC